MTNITTIYRLIKVIERVRRNRRREREGEKDREEGGRVEWRVREEKKIAVNKKKSDLFDLIYGSNMDNNENSTLCQSCYLHFKVWKYKFTR